MFRRNPIPERIDPGYSQPPWVESLSRYTQVNVLSDIVLVIATLCAAVIDVRVRRIPNALTAALAVIAVGIHASRSVADAALAIVAGLAAFALGAIVFRLGWFGGGDVKLLAAACALISLPNCVALVAAILAMGAILALASATMQGRLIALLRSTASVAAHGAPTERFALPYGVAIAAGSVVYTAWSLFPSLKSVS
jgi:prepilin peptidase CpaA